MPKERQLLKKTLTRELKEAEREIALLNERIKHNFADISVIMTKIQCLSQHKDFVEEIIQICVDRNRF